jgi:cyclopropane fatty-acyl-phospholipid synthase-like methyltransferase
MNSIVKRTAYRLLENQFVYDSYQSCVGSVGYRKKLVRKLTLRGMHTYLDLGCGTASTIDLLPKDCDYHGIDTSEKYLKKARSKRVGLNLILGDISESNWINSINLKSPTICIALGIFHHLSDKELDSMLENCLKVLPKGSQLFQWIQL